MNSIERISNILNKKPVDRIGIFETFWSDTQAKWVADGKISEKENLNLHFGHDILMAMPFNMIADLNYIPEVISEDEDTITQKDGNGAILRRHKKHASTPEHVSYTVTEKQHWDEFLKPILLKPQERINFEGYRSNKNRAKENEKFFCWCGRNVFEHMHLVCGHENLLVGMALEPEWILDMANTYADLIISNMQELFEKEGKPDGIWFYEDMGFKHTTFMSPDMYQELIMPAHKKTMDYVKSIGLKTIMHSCGFIEPFLPYMIEAGIDCLQAMEIKAGMDLLRIYENFGDKIALMGGIDVRAICSNDKNEIDKILKEHIPIVKKGFGYILHSDHSIPNTVEYDTYKYFVEKGLELGKY